MQTCLIIESVRSENFTNKMTDMFYDDSNCTIETFPMPDNLRAKLLNDQKRFKLIESIDKTNYKTIASEFQEYIPLNQWELDILIMHFSQVCNNKQNYLYFYCYVVK